MPEARGDSAAHSLTGNTTGIAIRAAVPSASDRQKSAPTAQALLPARMFSAKEAIRYRPRIRKTRVYSSGRPEATRKNTSNEVSATNSKLASSPALLIRAKPHQHKGAHAAVAGKEKLTCRP